MTPLASITKADVADKTVLVRVDWNVPLGPTGEVLDSFRITATLPTLRHLIKRGVREIILLAHLGSPVVRPRETVERTMAGNRRLVLEPIARFAARALGAAWQDGGPEEIPGSPLPGYRLHPQVSLLENLRFHPGELRADPELAAALAHLGDLFVNDAFSESHRAVASLVELSKRRPAFAGERLLAELDFLDRFLTKTDKPVVFVLGGAKVADKLGLIDNLIKKVDAFLLGGVMANTFLAAQGVDLRQSLVETGRLEAAKELFNRAPQKFILPLDFVWERDRVLDVGSQTVALFSKYFAKAKLIFWNGPMGWTASGRDRFVHGSVDVARAITASSATTVAAGGDTLAVIDQAGLASRFSFLSTGGGATLAYLSGAEMPGLAALGAANSKS